MKRLLVLMSLFIGVILLSACDTMRVVRGTGGMTEEMREVSGFNAIALDGLGTMFIEQGDKESLRIEAEDNLISFLESEIEENTLLLRGRTGINIVPTQGIFYYLTVRDLESISVNGLGNVDLRELNTPQLTLAINGGGEINAQNLDTPQLEVKINGLGSLNMDGGQVQEQHVTIDGGGSYSARTLASDAAEISINGLGSATIWAEENLDVSIDGGGSVQYTGKPRVNQSINGVGSVSALE
ncbi:MAG: head GIN domain-containing protein [Candidatus Promineifilaceae bacterium]|nr:head GIN domain-containing protein [Candidatus Promineifilaceae bacterium]